MTLTWFAEPKKTYMKLQTLFMQRVAPTLFNHVDKSKSQVGVRWPVGSPAIELMEMNKDRMEGGKIGGEKEIWAADFHKSHCWEFFQTSCSHAD